MEEKTTALTLPTHACRKGCGRFFENLKGEAAHARFCKGKQDPKKAARLVFFCSPQFRALLPKKQLTLFQGRSWARTVKADAGPEERILNVRILSSALYAKTHLLARQTVEPDAVLHDDPNAILHIPSKAEPFNDLRHEAFALKSIFADGAIRLLRGPLSIPRRSLTRQSGDWAATTALLDLSKYVDSDRKTYDKSLDWLKPSRKGYGCGACAKLIMAKFDARAPVRDVWTAAIEGCGLESCKGLLVHTKRHALKPRAAVVVSGLYTISGGGLFGYGELGDEARARARAAFANVDNVMTYANDFPKSAVCRHEPYALFVECGRRSLAGLAHDLGPGETMTGRRGRLEKFFWRNRTGVISYSTATDDVVYYAKNEERRYVKCVDADAAEAFAVEWSPHLRRDVQAKNDVAYLLATTARSGAPVLQRRAARALLAVWGDRRQGRGVLHDQGVMGLIDAGHAASAARIARYGFSFVPALPGADDCVAFFAGLPGHPAREQCKEAFALADDMHKETGELLVNCVDVVFKRRGIDVLLLTLAGYVPPSGTALDAFRGEMCFSTSLRALAVTEASVVLMSRVSACAVRHEETCFTLYAAPLQKMANSHHTAGTEWVSLLSNDEAANGPISRFLAQHAPAPAPAPAAAPQVDGDLLARCAALEEENAAQKCELATQKRQLATQKRQIAELEGAAKKEPKRRRGGPGPR